MSLPTDSKARKEIPVTTGVLDYFPLAIAAVAVLSKRGNDKHNPGEPLHWSREKSSDHRDCVARHLIDAGPDGQGVDENGDLHLAACAWRALAALQLALEAQSKECKGWMSLPPGAPMPCEGHVRILAKLASGHEFTIANRADVFTWRLSGFGRVVEYKVVE